MPYILGILIYYKDSENDVESDPNYRKYQKSCHSLILILLSLDDSSLIVRKELGRFFH